MTAAALLADLYRRGIAVRIDGDRLGVRAPDGVLTPEVRAALIAHKPQLLQLVAMAEEYRKLVRDGFNLLLEPSGPSTEQREVYLDEQARLTDELGPRLATAIYLVVGREWRAQTSVCPWCDEEGRCHEPPSGSEVS
jgi:hypothetical protein